MFGFGVRRFRDDFRFVDRLWASYFFFFIFKGVVIIMILEGYDEDFKS